jgi:hypothetical protein
VRTRADDIRRLGATVLIVTPSKPDSLRGVTMPFEVLCDPERVAYRYFGLERGGLSMFLSRRVLVRYLRMIVSGLWPHRPEPGEDVYQLGGDFVLSADRRLLFAHRSHDPADRPRVEDLIRHLSPLPSE